MCCGCAGRVCALPHVPAPPSRPPHSDKCVCVCPQVTGLYFSASWCPPCVAFTPQLAAFVSTLPPATLQIVFISADKAEADFRGYYAKMPWLALPFSDRDRAQELSARYKVGSYPTLVLLDEAGNVITTKASKYLRQDPTGKRTSSDRACARVCVCLDVEPWPAVQASPSPPSLTASWWPPCRM